MSDPQISEIWTARIYYKGNTGDSKPRPVLIVNVEENNGMYTIQEITSVEPNDPPSNFDIYKEPIVKWHGSGLNRKSFIKCSPTNTHRIGRIRLHGYVGIVDEDDFENIIDKIVDAKRKFNR